MDDIVLRSRYPRHNVSGKRKKKSARDRSGIGNTIARQAFISLLILAAALAAKYSNTPLAKNAVTQIQYVLASDIELKGVSQFFGDTFRKWWNSSAVETKATNPADTLQTSETSGSTISMMTVPVNGKLSSPFGERTDPLTGVKKMHEGVDIDAEKGEGIKAALEGVVIEAGTSKTYGKYVKLKHKDNLITVYAHCSALEVTEGQLVKQGEEIGKVGNTGAALGVNLHFEIWKNEKPEDPLGYISIN